MSCAALQGGFPFLEKEDVGAVEQETRELRQGIVYLGEVCPPLINQLCNRGGLKNQNAVLDARTVPTLAVTNLRIFN